MNIKKVFGVVGLLATGYGVGKLAGEIKMIRIALDFAEEAFPGIKRVIAESVSEGIIEEVFGDSQKKKKGES